jgi:hypothetical protein
LTGGFGWVFSIHSRDIITNSAAEGFRVGEGISEDPLELPPLFADCAVCGVAIRRGDDVVAICRTNERVKADGNVDIFDEERLAYLCVECGLRYPAGAIRLVFEEPSE